MSVPSMALITLDKLVFIMKFIDSINQSMSFRHVDVYTKESILTKKYTTNNKLECHNGRLSTII